MFPQNWFSLPVPALILSVGIAVGAAYVTIGTAGSTPFVTPHATALAESGSSDSDPHLTLDEATVLLNNDGHLTGRLSTIRPLDGELQPSSGVDVRLVSLAGAESAATTGSDGTFEFVHLSPGVYIMSAHGSMGALSMAIRVARRYDADAVDLPGPFSRDVHLDVAMAGAEDLKTIGEVIAGAEVEPDVDELHPDHHSPRYEESSGRAERRRYLTHGRIPLAPDGSLRGQVMVISRGAADAVGIQDLNVSFLHNGEIVASTHVQPNGEFVQDNLPPGTYSMIVAGKDGVGYIGVDVIGNPETLLSGDSVPSEGPILTSLRLQPSIPIMIGIVRGTSGFPGSGSFGGSGSSPGSPGGNSAQAGESAGQPGTDAFADGLSGGGLGGGVGGGLGGGPGGGGFGELLGVAGAALGAAAVLNSDDDAPQVASPGE